tara:strand:+ start:754 stop:1101 length:348 start_codon:yes stop_codon:yes gene_type:complete
MPKKVGGMKTPKKMGGMKTPKKMGGMKTPKKMGGKRKTQKKSYKKKPTIRNLMKTMKKMFKGGSGAATHGVSVYGNMGQQDSVGGGSNVIKTAAPVPTAGLAPPEMKGGKKHKKH